MDRERQATLQFGDAGRAETSVLAKEGVCYQRWNGMQNIKHILCPVDLTRDSSRALGYAAALARVYEAKLSVCYCTGAMSPAADPRAHAVVRADLEQVIKRTIDLYVSSAESIVADWESVIVEGDNPAQAIVRVAGERDVDLIMMGSRRRPMRAALLGSTAEAIYRTAPCPVLITHPDERTWIEPTSGEIKLKRILVAHDFSDYADLALHYAQALAHKFQAELYALHVIAFPALHEPELAWMPGSEEDIYRHAMQELVCATSVEADLDHPIERSVRWGKPDREILAHASERKIDLICIGAHGKGFDAAPRFGSNVDRVLRRATCPVFVARPLKSVCSSPCCAKAVRLMR